jgi:single-strand DNA-binding protein
MAEGLNKVLLLGNLGADPELKMTPGGNAVLKLRLATSESYLDRNKQRQERTEWHRVTIWGRRAEALARILSKGSRIFVEGGLRTSSYEDRDGNKRYTTEIVASNILLQGGQGGGSQGGRGGGRDTGEGSYAAGGGDFEPAPPDYDAAPEPRSSGGSSAGGGSGAGYGGSQAPTPDDDDIPF